MPLMPRIRRVVARRPWLQWIVVAALATATAATVADAVAAVDAERAGWGTGVPVWVAATDVAPGEPIDADRVEVPRAVRPLRAVDDPNGRRARQSVGRGEIVTEVDVLPDRELALAPEGWLVAPVRESTPSAAPLGASVQVVSDGFVLAERAVVVGFADDVVLLAVPADLAPLVPAAADTSRVTLLRFP